MQRNFIDVFDDQLSKVANINDKNEESLELVWKIFLKQLDAAGRVVRDATYKELQTLSLLIVDFLQPLLPTSVNKVSVYKRNLIINN